MLTDNAVMAMINRGESDCVEFAETDKDREKIRQTICAFANDVPNHGKPGFVVIGIQDDGSCASLTMTDHMLRELGGPRSEGTILPIPAMDVGKGNLKNCEVAVIRVRPSESG